MGLFIAMMVVLLWGLHLFTILPNTIMLSNMHWILIHIMVQTYLYTGLFITAHDAMHGSISKTKWVNSLIGHTATTLFAGLSYRRLLQKHHQHHKFAGTSHDPDFSAGSQNFFIWYFRFIKTYATIPQFVFMALLFNVGKLFYSELSMIILWIIPAFLSSLQLFYFGTYRPHKYPHDELKSPHYSRTQSKNHFIAMITCYFFGYHLEHHEHPYLPWWQLYKAK